jgi:hypothetical protein
MKNLIFLLGATCSGKTKILLKNNGSDSISNGDMPSDSTLKTDAVAKIDTIAKTDVFRINEDFTHTSHKIIIHTLEVETREEEEQVNEFVFEDRVYQVDAAIVRLLKDAKQMKSDLLHISLNDIVGFIVSPEDFKKRVLSLIDRDFISMDDRDKTLYHYMA